MPTTRTAESIELSWPAWLPHEGRQHYSRIAGATSATNQWPSNYCSATWIAAMTTNESKVRRGVPGVDLQEWIQSGHFRPKVTKYSLLRKIASVLVN
ncbi:hypothetical protein [Herbaspirillum aquaticum]|uniref:hypothetical protein n=1 Tax=Herbaspirillum aquaticum TaxID=568783 RepID=UPI0024DDF999|nr:hypothetical protein [Herbaspirillum aquaticum]